MKTIGQTQDQRETEASALPPDIVGFPTQLIHALRFFCQLRAICSRFRRYLRLAIVGLVGYRRDDFLGSVDGVGIDIACRAFIAIRHGIAHIVFSACSHHRFPKNETYFAGFKRPAIIE